MALRTLKHLKKAKGKRVLLRLDLNVPMDSRGRIVEGGDARILAAIPTIKRLMHEGARVYIVSHLGRPQGVEKSLSLSPVCKRLSALLGAEVDFVRDAVDDADKLDRRLAKVQDGEAVMLENIRFLRGEDAGSVFLARRLAELADVYVNDAFSACHRDAASVSGVAKLLPSYAGLQLEKEIAALSRVDGKPKRPFVVMLGGAKVADKIQVIERMALRADAVMIGGAMATAFLKAKGMPVGKSRVSAADVRLAKSLLRRRKPLLPVDVLCAKSLDGHGDPRVRDVKMVQKDEYIVDVGTQTVLRWASFLKTAKTLVWNGPLGLFEVQKFSHGSVSLGRMLAARSGGKAFGVVGGGETVACLQLTGMAEFVDHISTGGGAMLEYLAGRELPGLLPLMK